jgi:aromatic-amino-acid transaminase
VAALSERAPVLLAWTASKAFAQYGARVGALVGVTADPDARRRIANALGYSCRGTWSNCNHLGMLAVTRLLTDPELLRESTEERAGLCGLLQERVEVFNRLAHDAGLVYPRYEGGFFVTVFARDAKRAAQAMRERGVYVVPLAGGLRVAICATPRRSMPRLVEALSEGIRASGG